MNKRERVMAVIRGEQPDYVPTGFWIHFPQEEKYGEPAVRAHLRFFEGSAVSIKKIMNEYTYPVEQPIHRPVDWSNVKAYGSNSEFIRNQAELVKQIVDRNAGDGVLLCTVQGLIASAWKAIGRPLWYPDDKTIIAEHLRENKAVVHSALQSIAETLCVATEAMLKAGADGIYYATLGGERQFFTDDEFEELIKPLEFMILGAAKSKPCFNLLHLCKGDLNLKRYVDYPAEVVNWGVYENNLTLAEGARLFSDKVILGGFDDRAGVLVEGSSEAIRQETIGLLNQMSGRRFLLGADCTLPTEIDSIRLREADAASRTWSSEHITGREAMSPNPER